MPDQSWLDRLSLAIADGSDTLPRPDTERDGESAADSGEAKCLEEIAQLGRLFSQAMTPNQTDALVCPFRWGRLQASEIIGSGSFSTVYRAEDPVLRRDVALKLYRTDGFQLDSQELINEARQHAQVRHPRVLAIHGADVEDGVAGFWMDLLQGHNLAEFVADHGTLPQSKLLQLASDLIAGLGAVHEKGIVHGDLKPANVWIEPNHRALLMDFGAAQDVSSDQPMRFGTPLTMAPELFEEGTPSTAADIYALGTLLWFAATGKYPIYGKNFAKLKQVHRSRITPSSGDLSSDLPRSLRDLILSMLSRDPTFRPELNEIGQAIIDIEQAPHRRFKRFAVAGVIASLTLGLVASLWFLNQTRQAKLAAELELQRNEEISGYLRAIIEQPQTFRQGRNVTIAEGIRALAPRMQTALLNDPIGRAMLLGALGDTTASLGEYDLGRKWLIEAKTLLEEQGKTDSTKYRHAVRALAGLEGDELDYAAGIAYLDSESKPFQLPPNVRDDDLLDAAMLATLYSAAGNHDRAMELATAANQALKDFEFVRADDHLLVSQALTRSLGAANQHELAVATAQEGIAWAQRNALPERHGKTIVLRESMVAALIPLGRLEEAELAVDKNLQILNAWLGPNDSATARNENLKSITLVNAGRYQEAAELMETLYAKVQAQQSLPEAQVDGLINNLANAYKEIGRAPEALDLYRQLQTRAATEYGQAHPQYLMVSSNIAETLVDMGRYSEARAAAEHTMQLDQQVFGDEHPYTNHARTMLGAALTGLGELNEAESLLRKAQGHMLNFMGPQSPLYVQTSVKLAQNLQSQARAADASKLAQQIIEEAGDALGADHPYIAKLRDITIAP